MSARIAKAIPLGLVAAIVAVGVAACGQPNSVTAAQKASNAIQSQFEVSQPIPQYPWSQIRANLIDIEGAEAHGAQSTTFFFNLGEQSPIQSCPSIGFPIASTDEITSPDQGVKVGSDGTTVAQIDPNGIFQGDSTGTYVECVAASGTPYYVYWEGYVYTATGPAVWDKATNSIQMTGPSSVIVHTSGDK